ncbi:DNA-binding protein [Ralstonia thomasii]
MKLDDLHAKISRIQENCDDAIETLNILARTRSSESTPDKLSAEWAEKIAQRAVQLYAERHPRPRHVTMTQAAEMLELSQPTVRKLLRAGKLKLNGCGLIPVEQIDHILLAD